MNILRTLEKGYSKAISEKIVKHIGRDPSRFADLVAVFLAGPYRITQRAVRPLSYCIEAHPELIKPHLSKLLAHIKKPAQPVAVIRNIVRLLQYIEIPASQDGRVAGICFDLFQDAKQPVAVRVFSMRVLGNIAIRRPELKNELKLMIEDQMPFGSAGFVSRARKVLKQLE